MGDLQMAICHTCLIPLAVLDKGYVNYCVAHFPEAEGEPDPEDDDDE